MKSKLILIILLTSSAAVRAEERGIVFRIGESILKLAGYSYAKLEKNMQQNERALKNCSAYKDFLGPEKYNQIEYNIIDILKAGCRGTITLTEKEMSPAGVKTKDMETIVKTSSNRWGNIQTKEDRPVSRRKRFGHHLSLRPEFPRESAGEWPIITLGKMYQTSFNSSGGTLEKGEYDYEYIVTEGASKALNIVMKADTAQEWNHRPTSELQTFIYKAECKSIKELEEMTKDTKKK